MNRYIYHDIECTLADPIVERQAYLNELYVSLQFHETYIM